MPESAQQQMEEQRSSVNLPLKAGINRMNILKYLGEQVKQETLTHLNIKSEDCKIVEPPLFSGFNFLNLRVLKIESPILNIPDRLFDELPDLVGLDLSHNQIETLKPNVLRAFKNLQSLDLSW